MIAMIAGVWGPLLAAALCGGVAGWVWHAGRIRPRYRALEAERRRLRTELLDLAVGLPPIAPPGAQGQDENNRRRIVELERALAEARGRVAEADVLRHRIAELERDTGPARAVAAIDVTDYTKRIAALEGEIEAARRKVAEAETLQARLAELQNAAAPADTAPADTAEADLAQWRARYFAARTTYLEGAAKAAEDERAQLRTEAAALREKLAAPPPDDAEKTQLVWRNRYLAERLKYVESGAAAAVPPADPEEEDRRRWRLRYLETRLAHLEAQPKAPPVDVAPLNARIAELEQKHAEAEGQAGKLIEAEDEVIRARWTGRYLQARVKYLEDKMTAAQAAEAAAKAAPAAPAPVVTAEPMAPAPAPAPEPAVFRMERPAPLSAARGGAPDDLTLIEGVTAQTEAALRALGVHHFDQIAAWSAANAAWVNQYLNLGGRIRRERWIEQAQALAAG